jgi:hypothetical protein
MFISADYAEKVWTRHERRSALARVIEEGGDYLLPARFDDTELPGLRPTTAYVDLRQIARAGPAVRPGPPDFLHCRPALPPAGSPILPAP